MSGNSERPQNGPDVAQVLAADGNQRRALAAWARSALGLCGPDVEDVLQETYVELLQYPSAIYNPEGFVFQVFRARCSKLRRRRRARPDMAGTDERLADLSAPPARVEERLLLEQGLAQLTPRCRQLILAYYFEGKMPRETAPTVDLASAKVVSEITSRCLRRLRKWLQGR